jgi:hypothetical protein
MKTLLLPESWVEKIWSVMRATYGATFDRQWECPEGVAPARHVAELRMMWARQLGGFLQNPKAIDHALSVLPEFPPNLVQFAELCRRAPQGMPLQLPSPRADQAIVDRARNLRPRASRGPREWIVDLQHRMDTGEKISITEKAMLRAAQKNIRSRGEG